VKLPMPPNFATALLSLCLILFTSVRPVHGESITIAVGDWPPYLSADLKHGGIVGHLLTDVFEAEGYQVEMVFLPWARAYDEAKLAKNSMTGVWMYKPEREEDFYYSEPVLNEQFVFFHLKSNKFEWQNLNDLKGLSIGGGIEYSYGADFDAALADGTLTIQRVPTKHQNWSKLLKGRLDIYPEEINVGYSSLKQHFTTDKAALITHHPKPLLNNLSYLLLPKSSARSRLYLDQFNSRLKQFKESGRYNEYFNQFQNGFYEK